MPRRRKQNTRNANKMFFILCEGEKTEPQYFQSLINTLNYPEKLLKVKVVKTRKNTCKELVNEGKDIKGSPKDEVWVVVDKDGYTHHPQAFNTAKDNKIQIAFSSIAFEIWVLCHFEKTTRQFPKSEDVIKYINTKRHFPGGYQKNDPDLYTKIKDKMTSTAFTNAKFLRNHHKSANPGKQTYTLDPYTNVDVLVQRLLDLEEEYAKKHSR